MGNNWCVMEFMFQGFRPSELGVQTTMGSSVVRRPECKQPRTYETVVPELIHEVFG